MDQVNGHEVASTNIAGAVGSFRDLGLRFLGGIVDLELAQRFGGTPDRDDVANQTAAAAPTGSPLADTLKAITPTQYVMLAGAGVLAFGLAAGWFR